MYPRETVVAEKFEALVRLGTANTRLKDFLDLWEIAQSFDFNGESLASALDATFKRRRTPLPAGTPVGASVRSSRPTTSVGVSGPALASRAGGVRAGRVRVGRRQP